MSVISDIQNEFVNRIKMIFKDNKESKKLQVIYKPECNNIGDININRPNMDLYYLKPVIVVVPHRQYPSIVSLCPTCNTAYKPHGWNNNPAARYVHGLKSSSYLLQYRYKCQCDVTVDGMTVLDTMPSIFRNAVPISVVTDGKSAVDTELMIYLTSEATSAKSLHETAASIGTYRCTFYMEQRLACCELIDFYLKSINSTVNDFPTFSHFDDHNGFNEVEQPSDDLITTLFMNYVNDRSELIKGYMERIPIPYGISMDHTYNCMKRTTKLNHATHEFDSIEYGS